MERFTPFRDPELEPSRASYIRGVESTPSNWQMWKSNFENTLYSSIVGGAYMLNVGMDDKANGSPVLQPEQLRSMGIESDRAATPLEAVISRVVNLKRDKNKLITENQGWAGGLSSGLAGSLIDMPVYSAAEGIIRGTGNWALKMPVAKTLANTQIGASAMRFFNETVKGAVIKGGAINALSAAVIENPIMEQVAKRVGYEFTQEDASNNILYSALFGGAIEGLGKYVDMKRQTLQNAADLENFSNGKTPSDTSSKVMDRDRFGDSPRLEFKQAEPTPRSGRVYASHVSSTREFNSSTQRTFNSKFGEGVVATNNREFAVGEVTSSLLGEKGQVLELDLAEVNLLDADATIAPELKSSLVSKLETIDSGLAKKVSKAEGSTRDIVETLEKVAERKNKPEISEAVREVVKSMGYDGYEFRVKDSSGSFRGGDADRAIHVFDKEKFTLTGVDDQAGMDISKTPEYYYQAEREEMARMLEPSSDLHYDDVVYKELDNQPLHMGEEVKFDIEQELSDLRDISEELKDIDLSTNEGRKASVSLLKKEIESIERLRSIEPEKVSEVAKASEFCNRI